jgi:hypothetical protein
LSFNKSLPLKRLVSNIFSLFGGLTDAAVQDTVTRRPLFTVQDIFINTRLQISSIPDCKNNFPQDQNSPEEVVLDDLFDGPQKSGVSMLSLQRMLEIGSYKTVWAVSHKIHKAWLIEMHSVSLLVSLR